MKIRLIRPYMTRRAGSLLSSVPAARAKKLIERGIAMLAEDEKKGKKNAVASNKKSKRRTRKPNRDEVASKG